MDKIKAFILANLVVILLGVGGVLGVMYLWQTIKGWNIAGKLEKVEGQNRELDLKLSNVVLANKTLSDAISAQNAATLAREQQALAWQTALSGELRKIKVETTAANQKAADILSRPFSSTNSCINADEQAKLFGKGK